MLNLNESKKLADRKAICMFGEEFCEKYSEHGGSAFSEEENFAYFNYGMTDEQLPSCDKLCLTEVKYKYYIEICVNKENGDVTILKSNLPQRNE